MTTLHIAGGGIELVIWLVFIIITMVAQAIKGAKKLKGNRPSQEPGQSPRPHLDPQQELEEFLESLSRGGAKPAQPAPQPTPEPVSEGRRAEETHVDRRPKAAPHVAPSVAPAAPRRVEAAHVDRRPKAAPPRVVQAPAPIQTIVPPIPTFEPSTPKPAGRDKNYVTVDPEEVEAAYYHKLRMEIGEDLTDRHTLRKAVLLQEILNPPIALRHQQDR